MKVLLFSLILISSVFGKETQFEIHIPYSEGRIRFQGSYFLKPNKDGLVSLKLFGIERKEKFSAKQIESILKEKFISEADGITVKQVKVKKVSYDLEKLKKNNQVFVSGLVQTPGTYSVTKHKTLGAIITQAKPTAFASVRRVMLLRNEETYIYDIRKAEHASLKLLAGDAISVPQKHWIGK